MRGKGHGNNGRIVKPAYVHERKEGERKRKRLSHAVYFGGVYPSEENKVFWEQVRAYIDETYDTGKLKRIYFQSDGGGWMKYGAERLGGVFVLDGFHLRKYVKRMCRLSGCKEEESWLLEQIRGEGTVKLGNEGWDTECKICGSPAGKPGLSGK